VKLYELAYACRLYGGVAGFDDVYRKMKLSLGESPDLAPPEQRHALMKFLNGWGCRIAESNFEELKSRLQRWASFWVPQLPLPASDIRLMTPLDRGTVGRAYEELLKLGEGLHLSHTAAAKTLHALRPQVLPVWDSAIKDAFSAKPRTTPLTPRQLYPAFIEDVAGQISELEEDARRFNISLREVPRMIARDQNSLIKIADEYAWVTITLRYQIPDRSQLEAWQRWCP